MTNYPPSAFGADTITDAGIFDSDVIAHRDFTTEEVNSLLEDIPTLSSLLDPQETSQPIASKPTYRGRFMRGKEDEYAATEQAFQSLYGSPSNHHLSGIRECRKFASFKREKVSGEVKVFASACRERWCPMCAGQKASFAKEQTQMYIESLQSPRFLTLTLKNNGNDLKFQMDFLMESFRTLRQRAYWKRNVTGGIWYLQIKRGEDSGCWHPHFHILLDGNYMEQKRLSQLWEQVTFGSPVIDIRRISNPEEAAGYVARYTARPANLKDMPLLDRVEVITALAGKRLCGTFGTGKTVTLTPPKVAATGEWQEVGYYDKIVHEAKKNPHAKAILRAYFNDEILTEEKYKAYTGLSVNVEWNSYEPKEHPQMYLDFY